MNCAYCDEGKLLDAFGIKICELPASKVYLFKEQSHRGRCIVASKFHVSEIVELSPDERHAFMDDVSNGYALLTALAILVGCCAAAEFINRFCPWILGKSRQKAIK